MRHWAGPALGTWLGLALLAAPNARARPSASDQPVETVIEAVIEVEQAPGSEACPDKEAIFRSIKHLFPERPFRQSSDSSQSTARAHVTIRPLAAGHEAVLTLLAPRHGERVIREEDQDCRGLADALALAFVLLVAPPDARAESQSAGATPQPGAAAAASSPSASAHATQKPAAPEENPRAPERVPESAPAQRSFRAGVGASFVGGLGVLSEPALGAAGELELFHRRGWGLSLQGLRLWSPPAEAEGGSVTLTLWALLAAPCYRQPLTAASSLDACLRFGIGAQYARVEGFVSPQSGNFPWLVLVPELSYRHGIPGLAERLSGFVRIGFVGQLRPQSFSVRLADGSGENAAIANAPKFGVMANLGLIFGSALF